MKPTLEGAIELLTDGCRLAEAYAVTSPEEDTVIAAGLRLVNRQLLRCGRIQTGDLSDQDRAAILTAAKVVEEATDAAAVAVGATGR